MTATFREERRRHSLLRSYDLPPSETREASSQFHTSVSTLKNPKPASQEMPVAFPSPTDSPKSHVGSVLTPVQRF